MKIKSVTYGMLRITKPYENDRAEVTIELEIGDTLGDAVREAKKIVQAALKCDGSTPTTFETLYPAYVKPEPCCERDNDGDGNCRIHESKGVLRAKVKR